MEMKHSATGIEVENTKPKRWALLLGGLVLLVAAAVAVSLSLAKMHSTASGQDNAQVAAFIAAANGDNMDELNIDCGDPNQLFDTYTVTVTNQNAGKAAEVALTYDVVLTLPALPDSLAFTLSTDTGSKTGVVTNSGQTSIITFEDAGSFAAGIGADKTHTLTVTANPDAVTEDFTLAGITVGVTAEQID